MGRIFVPTGKGFFKTHATRPIPYLRKTGQLRLFFSSRCSNDIPYPTFIDVEPNNPQTVLAVNETPMMSLGRPGTFDDSGITPVSILRQPSDDWMYYVGWKRRRYGVTIETSIGLARLESDGDILSRVYEGPILAQDINHPLMTAAPFVIDDGDRLKMWYCSGTDWRITETGPEPIYTVFYAESHDGVKWIPNEHPVIDYKYDGEVISAPWVVKVKEKYCMWYSIRGHATKEAKNYTIGYAESPDGVSWKRLDELVGISRSESGWDSEMICYPSILPLEDKMYMFYCGNSVGKCGIGYAIAENVLV